MCLSQEQSGLEMNFGCDQCIDSMKHTGGNTDGVEKQEQAWNRDGGSCDGVARGGEGRRQDRRRGIQEGALMGFLKGRLKMPFQLSSLPGKVGMWPQATLCSEHSWFTCSVPESPI